MACRGGRKALDRQDRQMYRQALLEAKVEVPLSLPGTFAPEQLVLGAQGRRSLLSPSCALRLSQAFVGHCEAFHVPNSCHRSSVCLSNLPRDAPTPSMGKLNFSSNPDPIKCGPSAQSR